MANTGYHCGLFKIAADAAPHVTIAVYMVATTVDLLFSFCLPHQTLTWPMLSMILVSDRLSFNKTY